ncbi:hypothetical protein VNO77_34520 [Canavalia gladiata]|uniref:Uncharacterized protein n=1 Tax=Canavalia gladiata TaxID=3824 RepID=A0AAN9KGK4_CANGL
MEQRDHRIRRHQGSKDYVKDGKILHQSFPHQEMCKSLEDDALTPSTLLSIWVEDPKCISQRLFYARDQYTWA